jgi:hypothetical protein
MQAASKSRNAKVPVPMRTAIGARAIKPLATIRTASPGRKPNSAKRFPNSTGVAASAVDMDTTLARLPKPKSVSRMSVPDGAAIVLWAGLNMNAILYENRSHYYYGVTLMHCKSEQRRRSC